mmetsp:Transcript_6384/g.25783  ORF Transcript_6384/g.25783 Transcript_6384/m.25783 type:complete len:233 (-) Transcript_6384:1677-2375(-)
MLLGACARHTQLVVRSSTAASRRCSIVGARHDAHALFSRSVFEPGAFAAREGDAVLIAPTASESAALERVAKHRLFLALAGVCEERARGSARRTQRRQRCRDLLAARVPARALLCPTLERAALADAALARHALVGGLAHFLEKAAHQLGLDGLEHEEDDDLWDRVQQHCGSVVHVRAPGLGYVVYDLAAVERLGVTSVHEFFALRGSHVGGHRPATRLRVRLSVRRALILVP